MARSYNPSSKKFPNDFFDFGFLEIGVTVRTNIYRLGRFERDFMVMGTGWRQGSRGGKNGFKRLKECLDGCRGRVGGSSIRSR